MIPKNKGRILEFVWLAGAILFTLWLAGPRMNHSLWTDEQSTLLGPVHGSFVHDLPEGQALDVIPAPIWESPHWIETVWRYDSTNQHFLCSILSRASLNVWQRLFDKEPWEFSEPVLRLFPLLAVLIGIVIWFQLAKSLFGQSTALVFVTLLSFHPWVIRFGTEMRGYAYVFLLLPIVLFLAIKALDRPRWRLWTGFAVAQFLLLYSWPGMALAVVGINLALLFILRRKRLTENGAARVKFKRWFVANVLTLSLLAPFIVPTIYQIIPFIQEGSPRQEFNSNWWPNLFAHFAGGMDWTDWGDHSKENPWFHSIESLLQTHTALVFFCLVTFAGFFFFGWFRALRRFATPVLLATVVCLSNIAILVLIALISDIHLFPWYFFPFLPLVLLCVAHGLNQCLAPLPFQWRLPLHALWILSMLFFSWPKLNAMRSKPIGPLREAVVEVRGKIPDPRDFRTSGLLIAHVGGSAFAYDALGWLVFSDYVKGTDAKHFLGLVQLMSLADRTNSELYVIAGLRSDMETKIPEVYKWLENKEAFEHFKTLHGTEVATVRELYHYKGGFFDPLR
ncbi:MAG: glycosyltransferase family 39 protein [Verrucomicrobiota bacterium]